MRRIEILAPAGSYEGMKAAMNAGCDAVYIGGSSFGARAYADNPEEELLLRAIDEAHIRGKKLYLTVNTLLKEKELTEKLYRFLENYYRQGLDAVIVQDVGVLSFIHRNFPGLPIHASTQMTLTMAQGAGLLKDKGVTRLVTARELSFSEIRKIRKDTELEIETFVHGALCYCYSGQCLMSSMIGGRSGNRGRCAQPCRMPYRLYSDGRTASGDEGKYLLSPKDINTIASIPDLIDAGVDSFKIEGRMKRPEYAAAVAAMYRKYTDIYVRHGREAYTELLKGKECEKDMLTLMDVYNRGGFSGGYGNSYHGKHMMTFNRPNHSGVYTGKVEKVAGSKVYIRLCEEIHAQDILEIRRNEEEGYEFTVKDAWRTGELLETNVGIRKDASGCDKKNMPAIFVGMMVYRTKNNELLSKLTAEYMLKDQKLTVKGLLSARLGERLRLIITRHEFSVTVYGKIVQAAIRQPMTIEKLAAPIEKTGDTLYSFDELKIEADDNIFVPVAWLNEIRREAFTALNDKVTSHYRRDTGEHEEAGRHNYMCTDSLQVSDRLSKEEKITTGGQGFGITVSLQTTEQFEAALTFEEVTRINVEYDRFGKNLIVEMADKTANAGKSFYLSLPLICRLSVYSGLEKVLIEIIDNSNITGFLVKNFEEIALVKSLCDNRALSKEIILNYNMYIFNQEAKNFWREKNITLFTAPVELNQQELKQLSVEDCDLVVYGYLPLMVSVQCLLENTSGCRKNAHNHSGYLTDRLDKKFFLQTNCGNCYNIIYNGQPLSLHKQAEAVIAMKPRNIRLDFTIESGEQMLQVMKTYTDTFVYGKNSSENLSDYTTGHFKRGIE